MEVPWDNLSSVKQIPIIGMQKYKYKDRNNKKIEKYKVRNTIIEIGWKESIANTHLDPDGLPSASSAISLGWLIKYRNGTVVRHRQSGLKLNHSTEAIRYRVLSGRFQVGDLPS